MFSVEHGHAHDDKFGSSFSLPSSSPMSFRLQQLASKLKDLRRSAPSNLGDGSRASPMRRHPSQGLPVLRESQARQDEDQPVCKLDGLLSMRSPSDIHQQGERAWTRSAELSRAASSAGNHGGVGNECAGRCLHRSDCAGKTDGAQGQDGASWPDQQSGDPHDLCRVPGQAEEGRICSIDGTDKSRHFAHDSLVQGTSNSSTDGNGQPAGCSHDQSGCGERRAAREIEDGRGCNGRSYEQGGDPCSREHQAEGSCSQPDCRDGEPAQDGTPERLQEQADGHLEDSPTKESQGSWEVAHAVSVPSYSDEEATEKRTRAEAASK